jgi:hypothetical protein
MNEKRKHIIFSDKFVWKAAEPPAPILSPTVPFNIRLFLYLFYALIQAHMTDVSCIPDFCRRILYLSVIHPEHPASYRSVRIFFVNHLKEIK